jgi:hypothetical protein
MAIVYRHRDDFNNVFYVGISKNKNRPFNYRDRSVFWKRYSEKYGVNTEIVAEDIPYEDAKELEVFLIYEYGRRDLGKGMLVNMTDGGEGTLGLKHKKETKIKISKSNSGGTSWSKGIRFSKEHKDKISKGNKGKKRSKEQIKLMSKVMKGTCYAGHKILDTKTNLEYKSLNKYCEKYNLNHSTIWNNINCKTKNNKYNHLKYIN